MTLKSSTNTFPGMPFQPTGTLSRREWLRTIAAGSLGLSMSRWMPLLADDTATNPQRKRSVILLWMSGGPSQLDTFDLKPEHANGGEFKPIDTSVPGIQISEHLPQMAKLMEHTAVIRSMSTKEGDHTRATYLLRTGHRPGGPIKYPTMGSLLSKELASPEAELPNFISIAPYRFLSPAAFGPGFLGPQHAPMVVGADRPRQTNTEGENQYEESLRVANLASPEHIEIAQADTRLKLLADMERDFGAQRPEVAVNSHQSAYDQAVRLMRSESVKAFDLDQEPDALRDRYGRNQFGQGCLLARRLVERGVPFVELALNSVANRQVFGWDTHQNNFTMVKQLSEVLDPGWATLLDDLKSRGMLDSTLVVWMGEFGRTPKINGNKGRDHFPAAWSTVLSGGGIRGGQFVGNTGEDGMKVTDRPVSVPDLLATVCKAVGIDPQSQNMSNVGRPIRIVDHEAKPITEVLA